MKFKLNQLIFDQENLLNSIKQKKFISYVNVNSFRVGGNFEYDYNYYADGKPVAYLFSLLTFRSVKRLTALSIDDFWIKNLSDYRVIIVGYEDKFSDILKSQNLSSGIKIDHLIHGYHSMDVLKQKLENILSIDEVPTIIFLAIGQPKQEILLSMLKPLYGKVAIVCVGAYFKQRIKLINEYFPFWDSLGLTPILRFWNKPLILFKRTFYSLLFIPFRLKRW
jgi:UDP-N-acetyl-D-mannosaminuronic acid transferase (WecB/TagA/CpsF family)